MSKPRGELDALRLSAEAAKGIEHDLLHVRGESTDGMDQVRVHAGHRALESAEHFVPDELLGAQDKRRDALVRKDGDVGGRAQVPPRA